MGKKKKQRIVEPPARAAPTLKCTDEFIERIGALLCEGNFRTTSAILCGIAASTFYEWMKNGKEDGPEYEQHRKFRRTVLESEAIFEHKAWAKAIVTAERKAEFENDPQHIFKVLKYRNRKRFGDNKETPTQSATPDRPLANVSTDVLLECIMKTLGKSEK